MANPDKTKSYSGDDVRAETATSKNHLAVASSALGIASVLITGFLTGIPGVIIGVRAYSAILRGEADNRALALTGIILSLVGIIGSIALIAWVTIHGLPSQLK